MKKIYLILLILVIGIAALFYFLYPKPLKQEEQNQSPIPENNEPTQNNNSEDNLPLARARERVTKKPFAIKISPDNSPVSPEKFSGYHTGTDYEIFPEEENSDIRVFAVFDGPRQCLKYGYRRRKKTSAFEYPQRREYKCPRLCAKSIRAGKLDRF